MAKLVYPNSRHQPMVNDYIQETVAYGETYVNGGGGIHQAKNYDQWLKKEKQNHLGVNLDENKVPGTTYLYIENKQIVGMINIRHCLNDFLLMKGGHIGYSVLPSQRKKGYTTAMLKEAIEICKRWGIYPVLITCDKENIASRKTIEKCGGKLENEYYDQDKNETILRFWIGEEK